MKTIGIFYFSGTGNTELVAEMIRDKFEEMGCRVDLLRMEDIIKVGLHADPDQYDYLGIGCQVVGFGVPRLASEFIRDLPESDGKKTFIFRTAGGVAPVNYNASSPIIKNLTEKGYNIIYERLFSISSNWMVKFDDSIVRKLYEATKNKIGILCEDILNGKERRLRTGHGLRLLMGGVRTLSAGVLLLAGKDLVAGTDCNLCGLCVKNCPAENIQEKGGRIRFGSACSSCMRCVYSCPNQAIHYRLLKFFPVKGGYQLRNILSERRDSDFTEPSCESGSEPWANKGEARKIPPFFFEYIRNKDL
jgi:flavodoxin/ferredoxin